MDTVEDSRKGEPPVISLMDVPCTCSGGKSERALDHHSLGHRGRLLRQRENVVTARTEGHRAVENRQ